MLVSKSYDYNDGEIVYRIFVDEQLISERSLPVLNASEALLDTFVVKLDKNLHNIFVEELGDKKLLLKKAIVNNVSYGSAFGVKTKDFKIDLYIGKRNK